MPKRTSHSLMAQFLPVAQRQSMMHLCVIGSEKMLNINKDRIFTGTLVIIALLCSVRAFSEPVKKKIEVGVSSAKAVTLDIPVGELNVSGYSGKTIQAEVLITCQESKGVKCNNDTINDVTKDFIWSSRAVGDQTRLGLTPADARQYNDLSVVVNIRVPENKKLTVNFDYGDLNLQNVSSCLDVNVNAGDLHIGLKEKSLASATLRAMVGDVALTTSAGTIHGKRSKLVGASLEWDKGVGMCNLNAKVLTGYIEVALE